MENVLFTRSSTPSDEPIVDGQLIFDTSGTGKMYLDNGTDRLEMGGAMNVDSTLSKTSTNPIQNKAVAGVMLENLTDIDTVTTSGFLTDALATKELHTEVNEINNNLTNLVKSNTVSGTTSSNGNITIRETITGIIPLFATAGINTICTFGCGSSNNLIVNIKDSSGNIISKTECVIIYYYIEL